MESKIRELEEASRVVLAPPDLVKQEERHSAENVFLALRKTPLPYELCHFILEHCTNDYVLFQAASTLKEAVVREWTLLHAEQIHSLRSSILQYVTQRPQLQNYVREQLLATVAVIVKRARLDTNENASAVFSDISRLVDSGDLPLQLIACSLLTALLNEYSSSNRASSIGLPWELHCKCKMAFENEELKQVLYFCLQVLEKLEQQDTSSREVTAVFNRVLAIIEQVLSWEFIPRNIPRRLVGSFTPEQNVSFRPPRKWEDLVVKHGLVQMMFRIHSKVRHNQEMATHSLQCLSQLASLNGPVLPNQEACSKYLSNYLTNFLHFIQNCEGLQEQEALGVATIILHLTTFYSTRLFASLPEDLVVTFLQSLAAITSMFCQAAAKEESLHQDDQMYTEALQKILDAWTSIVCEDADLPETALMEHASDIFNTYLQCHLAPPEGTRAPVNPEDEEEYDEQDESDREKFKEALVAVGAFGRKVPLHSIPLLTKLIETRLVTLNTQLRNLKQPSANASTRHVLSTLYEDIHWLLLVAGHVLTEEAEGETPMIPSPIMHFSVDHSKSTDIQTTLAFLASITKDPVAQSESDHLVDPVVRLSVAVLRLCAVESSAIEAGLVGHVSPEVTASMMWFLRRWTKAYLLPDESYYSQMSLSLTSSFGQDSEGGQWTLNFLLDKIVSNIQAWSSEPGLMEDTLNLFLAMVEKRAICRRLVKCPALWSLAKDFAANRHPFDALPVSAKRKLCQILVMAGSGTFEDDENKNEYWQLELKSTRTAQGQIALSMAGVPSHTPNPDKNPEILLCLEVLQSLENRLRLVLSQPNLQQTLHTEASKGEVTCLLDSLCGVTEASRTDNVKMLFDFMLPMLSEAVKILYLYHNYEEVVALILEVFSVVTNRQICYLSPADCKRLYEAVLSMMQMYAQHNIGRKVITREIEEDQFSDILMLIEMMTNMLSKDFIDFAQSDEGKEDEVCAVDVVLYGLNLIVPLMTAELLKFPALCTAYIRLITYLAEIYPHKVCQLPDDLLSTLLHSIDHGFTNASTDIMKLCLEFLTFIATHVFHNKMAGSSPHQALAHFLKLVFHMLLMESFDMDLMETASEAFFSLICCHQELYQQLVTDLLSQQTDSAIHQRLLTAFTELTPQSLQLNIQRSYKNEFRENFELFLINVRGFLCVK